MKKGKPKASHILHLNPKREGEGERERAREREREREGERGSEGGEWRHM